MTTTPDKPGPGARLLAQQPGLYNPLAALVAQHPSGDRLHSLARALVQTATELDAAYARAQEAGRRLRALRSRAVTGSEGADGLSPEVSSVAGELALTLERCDVMDTALIRLLGVYQDIGPLFRQGMSPEQNAAVS